MDSSLSRIDNIQKGSIVMIIAYAMSTQPGGGGGSTWLSFLSIIIILLVLFLLCGWGFLRGFKKGYSNPNTRSDKNKRGENISESLGPTCKNCNVFYTQGEKSDVIMEAKGHNGQLEMTQSLIRIKRKGALAFLSQGLKGDKEILISQISSIQFKKAGTFGFNGYIQFAFVGGQEAKGGIFQGTQDENTVMFRVSQQQAFEAFRDELLKRITRMKSSAKEPSGLEELEKLASLRDKGIVSEEEFQQKKKKILGV